MNSEKNKHTSWIILSVILAAINIITIAQAFRSRDIIEANKTNLQRYKSNLDFYEDYIIRGLRLTEALASVNLQFCSFGEGVVLAVDEGACSSCVIEEIENLDKADFQSNKQAKYMLVPSILENKYKSILKVHNNTRISIFSSDTLVRQIFSSTEESMIYLKLNSDGRIVNVFAPIRTSPEFSARFLAIE